jgi:hypothetical protein
MASKTTMGTEASEWIQAIIAKPAMTRRAQDGRLLGVSICTAIHGVNVEWQPRGARGAGTVQALRYNGTILGECRDDITEAEALAFAARFG